MISLYLNMFFLQTLCCLVGSPRKSYLWMYKNRINLTCMLFHCIYPSNYFIFFPDITDMDRTALCAGCHHFKYLPIIEDHDITANNLLCAIWQWERDISASSGFTCPATCRVSNYQIMQNCHSGCSYQVSTWSKISYLYRNLAWPINIWLRSQSK